MDKRIIIIHPSELLRQGIVSVVRTTWPLEVIELSSPEELTDYLSIRRMLLLILADTGYFPAGSSSLLDQLEVNNKVMLIGIKSHADAGTVHDHFSHTIDLNTTANELLGIIGSLLPTGAAGDRTGASSELTDREREVLKMVALGYLNKEIADGLSISVHTVISHRKNITEKLGIKSISGLTVYAVLNGLIDTDHIQPGRRTDGV